MPKRRPVPLKQQIMPALIGFIACMVTYIVVGGLVRTLPMGDAMKGITIIAASMTAFIVANFYFLRRAQKRQPPE